MPLTTSSTLLICTTCGTQYAAPLTKPPRHCRICDDPRQFVPPTGQSFTTLQTLYTSPQQYHNVFSSVAQDSKVTEIYTEPKFGIGQSARLIKTPEGNVLWDCVSLLDESTVREIEGRGGLKAVVISHPHFYTTWADWSATFKCPVYTAAPDVEWLNRREAPGADHRLITEVETEIVPGLTAVICGGHFTGSMVLHSLPPNTDIPTLFVADTIFATASSHNPPEHHFPGVTMTYSFLWSIPNMIPLPPNKILRIWRRLKGKEFKATYGVMAQTTNVFEVEGDSLSLRRRLLDSMKIAVKAMGGKEHDILLETET